MVKSSSFWQPLMPKSSVFLALLAELELLLLEESEDELEPEELDELDELELEEELEDEPLEDELESSEELEECLARAEPTKRAVVKRIAEVTFIADRDTCVLTRRPGLAYPRSLYRAISQYAAFGKLRAEIPLPEGFDWFIWVSAGIGFRFW